MTEAATLKISPLVLGIYSGKSTATYNVHIFNGGFSCMPTIYTAALNNCIYVMYTDKINLVAYTYLYSHIIAKLVVYILITPIEVSFYSTDISLYSYIYTTYTISE